MNSVVNLEKKNSIYGLIQDLETLIYCLIMVPLSLLNIFNDKNYFTQNIYLLSYVYFIITGITNIYYQEINYIIHHIICLNLIVISQYDTNHKYLIWLSYCFLAEISNIFLSGKNILKHIAKIESLNKSLILTQINKINDFLFLISYFGIRIFYLIPFTYKFITTNYFDLKYPIVIVSNVIIMCLLNLYWSYMIIIKIKKMMEKTK